MPRRILLGSVEAGAGHNVLRDSLASVLRRVDPEHRSFEPVSWTSRRVRPPADTGTRTVPPAADQRPVPFSDTASRLWARTCRPAVPAWEVTRIVTVFEAGEKTHATLSGTGAGPERPRQPAISATSDSTATRTTARRNLYCRADTGR